MIKVIGLKRGIVKLKRHNPEWERLFEKEKKMLFKKFPKVILEISHGGSTAIPKIHAKPIIDMFAVVPSLKLVQRIEKDLNGIEYKLYSKDNVSGRILYTKGKHEVRTHHLHFVERKSNEWKNHILIKNYFLKHPHAVKEYSQLKNELAKKYPTDRKAYTHGKDKFIKSIIKKAKLENKK